jgi:hypothetical protein
VGQRTRGFGTRLPEWVDHPPQKWCHAELPAELKPPVFADTMVRCGRTEHKGAKHSASLMAPGLGSVMWQWR